MKSSPSNTVVGRFGRRLYDGGSGWKEGRTVLHTATLHLTTTTSMDTTSIHICHAILQASPTDQNSTSYKESTQITVYFEPHSTYISHSSLSVKRSWL